MEWLAKDRTLMKADLLVMPERSNIFRKRIFSSLLKFTVTDTASIFQSERISKAQTVANRRNINDLRYLTRNNLIIPYNLDIRKNRTVSIS